MRQQERKGTVRSHTIDVLTHAPVRRSGLLAAGVPVRRVALAGFLLLMGLWPTGAPGQVAKETGVADLRLNQGGVSGRVLDAKGRPVAGADVTAYSGKKYTVVP